MTDNGTHTRTRFTPLKIVVFIAVIFLLAGVLLELGLRIMGFSSWQIDLSVWPDVPGDITPRQDLVWRLPHIDCEFPISINDQGFRNPGRITPDARYRVVCLGDSSTMGYGVADHQTCPARLAAFLEPCFPGTVDVINAGTIGYTIDDELAWFREKGDIVKPDVVVLEIFFNDVIEKISRERATQREFRKKKHGYSPLRSLALKSAIYNGMRALAVRIMVSTGRYFPENPHDKTDLALNPDKYPDAWKAYDESLRTFITTVEKAGVDVLVVISPDKYQVYDWGYPLYPLKGVRSFQDHIIGVLDELGTPRVDLLPLFLDRIDHNPTLFVTDGLYDEHQSETGQNIKAEGIFAALLPLMRQRGLASLYRDFETAVVAPRGGAAGAFRSREWVSRDDSLGVALEGNVDVTWRGIVTGSGAPELRFGLALPWWTDDQVSGRTLDFSMKVTAAGDDATTKGAETVFSLETSPGPGAEPLPRETTVSLGTWKDTPVDITCSLRYSPEEGADPPRLLMTTPQVLPPEKP